MTAGIIIRNDYGTVQIDDTYQNMYLTYKGFASLVGGTNQVASVDITVTGVDPILVVRGNYRFGLRYRVQSGSTFTFRIWGDAGDITYYVFDIVPPVMDSNPEFVVRDGAGNVTFHSNMKTLRIIDIINGMTNDAVRALSYGVDRQVAVALSNMGGDMHAQQFSSNQAYMHWYGAYFIAYGNVVEARPGAFTTVGPNIQDRNPPFKPWNAMIIDVTGF